MILALRLSEFRGFHRLRIEPLSRVNLILGRNNVGKSSVLEALFLLSGPTNPQLPLQLSALRGVEVFRNDAVEMWGWLFHKKDTHKTIEMEAYLVGTTRRSLQLRLIESKGLKFRPRRRPTGKRLHSSSSIEKPAELEMRYVDETGEVTVNSAIVKDTDLEFVRGGGERTLPNTIILTGRGTTLSENAERFSKLVEVDQEAKVVNALQRLDPRLKRLAVLVTGSGPVIHGDLGLGHMVPIHFMGDGFSRLLSIVLAIVTCPKGMVLIDEVESGLHYSAMVEAWAAIDALSQEHQVQVAATTHNWECLKAAHEAFGEADSLAVHRLERVDGEVEAVEFTPEMVGVALDSGMEVR